MAKRKHHGSKAPSNAQNIDGGSQRIPRYSNLLIGALRRLVYLHRSFNVIDENEFMLIKAGRALTPSSLVRVMLRGYP